MNLDAAWLADGVQKRKIRKRKCQLCCFWQLWRMSEGGAVGYTAAINTVEEEPETKAAVCQLLINFKPQLWLIMRAKWRLNGCNNKQMLAWFVNVKLISLTFKKNFKNLLAKFC